jgi:dTDP-4-amino-4,6-dideoxygalactose transaminase
MRVINVTQPYLPPLEEFMPYLREIWDTKWLTNNGPYHRKLEEALAAFLDVPYLSLYNNGTSALIAALKCLQLKGEVITTPYSFVATTHVLRWLGLEPVFVDVDPVFGNLDPTKVEAAITSETTAILPVHVYGNPCPVEQLAEIAEKHKLKIIYDAAHAFGVKYQGQSLLQWGDLAVLSFHATKCFSTIEGGAIICCNPQTKRKLDLLKNFGFTGETEIVDIGINAKLNEIQAAFGLMQLKYYPKTAASRKMLALLYRERLSDIPGLRWIEADGNTEANYSYFPLLIDEPQFGHSRDFIYEKLKLINVYTRRYFYPLIANLDCYSGLLSAQPANLPVANRLSEQVLCLPLYPELSEAAVLQICDLIRNLSVEQLDNQKEVSIYNR